MQAIQFSPKAPSGFASRVSAICREKDLLLLTTSVFETIRLIPPLTVTEGEMDQACDILHAAIIVCFSFSIIQLV
jgi:4-aminobutyrate aminotransferase